MSNAAMIPIEIPSESPAPVESFPVPGRVTASPAVVTRRALLTSVFLHVALVAAGAAAALWSPVPTTQAAVQTFDISVVPLSALDTVIPQGAPQQEPKQPEAAAPEQVKVAPPVSKPETKKKKSDVVTPAKKLTQTSSESSQTAPESQPNTASTNAASVGSANGTSSEPARISYQDMVATMLARAKRYPERALRRQTTGDGTIRIMIAASGDVTNFEIVQSTSSPILDEELKDMVERASPFPPFPGDLKRDKLALVVPVSFRLQQ